MRGTTRAALSFAFLAVYPGLALAQAANVPASGSTSEPAPPEDDAPRGAVPSGAAGALPVPPPSAAEPPAQVPVTPPKIVHFENAVYPPEAQEAGVQGDVILKLSIDKDGRVTDAQVTEPLGHGLDEAAVDAARKFVFEPARKGDKPIPARILYRYSFTLTVAPGQSAEAPKPTRGDLAGRVMLEEDMPLAGAAVRVRSQSGKEQLVSTDAEGNWRVPELEPGRYTVLVTGDGYDSVQQDEEVVVGQATEVVYRMHVVSEGGIEVTVRGERPPREVTRRTLERREIERIPGTNGDALRSLQNLPGVARPPTLSGLLIVRGSAPQDSGYYIDGIYVPIVYHFGGLSSVVPTEMLEKLDFYPGNFSAQYGRVMGGVVDVGLRSANADGKYHGLVQFDFIDGRMVAEGPVPGLKNTSFIVGGRRSWVDVWLKPVLDSADAGVTAAPVYYDYQAFIEHRPNKQSMFRLGVIGSDDRFEMVSKNGGQLSGDLGLHTGFVRVIASYRNQITDALRVTSATSYGSDLSKFNFGSYYFDVSYPVLIDRTEVAYKVGDAVTMNAGVDLEYAWYDANVRSPAPPRAGEPDSGPFTSRQPITLKMKDKIWRPAAYLEAEITPSSRARIVPSLRADYSRDTQKWDIGPRINGRYDLRHDYPRTAVKGGVGLYYQPPQIQETVSAFGTPGIHSNRAMHYTVGVEQEVTRNVEFSLEGFYKDLDQLVARVPVADGTYQYNNQGTGKVLGAELLLKYKPDSRFFGWVAYTLSRSTRRWPPDYEEQLFQYDQTHVLTVLGSYRLGRGWEFGARFRLTSGNPYTPYSGGILAADSGTYAPGNGAVYSQRYPMFHQLDLRVDKAWKYPGWTLRSYLDVQNVYNRSNPEGVQYNYNYTKSSIIGFLPIIPSLGIRAEF